MSYFRAIIKLDERSLRAFEITSEVVRICPGNYTGWYYRGLLVDQLQINLQTEKIFLSVISTKNPKNYQIWSYRRELLKKINNADGELEFVKTILDIDAKNIHAWGYRQWLIRTFGLWQDEAEFVEGLINADPLNNSAWSQRFYVLSHSEKFNTLELKMNEIEFAVNHCEDICNESPFNYLRAFWSVDLSEIIKEKISGLIKRSGISRQLLQFLGFVYEKEGKSEVQKIIYTLLEEIDFIRKSYWTWKKTHAKGKNISRTTADMEICKILYMDEPMKNVMASYYRSS